MFQSLLPRPLQWWTALSLLAYEQAFSRGALAAGQKRRLLLTPNSFPSSLPNPSTPEHPRRASSQECAQATGLLQCRFFRCHATLLSTPPLWRGALRDDTKKGYRADYGFSRPDAASGLGSLFQAARYSSEGIENTKIKCVTRSYFRIPLTYATSLLCENLETARPGETTAKC